MANVTNANHFIYSIQFDVEKPKTYTKGMQDPNAP